GKAGRISPEEMLVSGVASCYSITLAYLCERRRLPITRITMEAEGEMIRLPDRTLKFTSIRLSPEITLDGADEAQQKTALDLAQAREARFSLCQLNIVQTGITRADMIAIADAMLDQGVRPAAIGCYVNPLRPDDPTFMGTSRADLDVVLHSLDLIGARRV